MIETNPELKLAWQFIENTDTHLFLTGKAGTGKTTFLRALKEHSPKRMVVLAPTGIAAINAGGVTIHSFFQLAFAPFVPNATFGNSRMHYQFSKVKRNIIRSVDLLVIDEISMVRADLLDAIDDALRRYRDREKPFGGVQLLMIGDVQQLAPVIRDEDWAMLRNYYDSPYFFSSRALQQTEYMTIELSKVYRQQDNCFLSLLNKVRSNTADEDVLRQLNQRYIPNFEPPRNADYIRLTTHNAQAQIVNDRELAQLTTPSFSYSAEVNGNFPEYSFPTDERLTLKAGAQIMFVKNDSSAEKRYYNGMIGMVVELSNSGIVVRSKDNAQTVRLEPEEWTNAKYVIDPLTQQITEEIEGTFKQYPVRLAWAITVHKSQGLTFEHAIIDVQNAFAHGQTYVALSRCKTLEGMILDSPLRREAIICDAKVNEFNQQSKQHVPTAEKLQQLQQAYTLHLLHELFSFKGIEQSYRQLLRLLDEHFYKKYPDLLEDYKRQETVLQQLLQIAARFEIQYTHILQEARGEVSATAVQERIHAASSYFCDQLVNFIALHSRTTLVSDNKMLQKKAKERYAALGEALSFKAQIWKYEANKEHWFTVSDYLQNKAKILLGVLDKEKDRKSFSRRYKKKSQEAL